MRRLALAALLTLFWASAASAQFAPPGIGGYSRGSAFCQYLSSPPTLNNGQASPFQCDSSGHQIVVGAGVAGTPAGGVVSVQGVSGGTNLPVSQATAANLNATVVGTGTFAVQAAQSGNWTARIVGNTGNTVDFPGQNGASPQASVLAGGQFNTSPTTISSGNSSPLQLDASGNLKVNLVAQTLSSSPTNLNQVGGSAYALGSTAASAAMPVVLASNQTAADPCMFQAKSFGHFSSSTSGGSIITLSSGKKAYICSISVVSSTAANVSLIEGTGSSVCTGGTVAAVWGNTSTTAANGYSFAANGGLTVAGGTTLAANGTVSQNVCVIFTTTNSPQVNADVSFVQQ